MNPSCIRVLFFPTNLLRKKYMEAVSLHFSASFFSCCEVLLSISRVVTAVTVTSFKCCVRGFSRRISVLSHAGIAVLLYPTHEMCSVSLSEMGTRNSPFSLLKAPLLPAMKIVAYGNGSPVSASTTRPRNSSCAWSVAAKRSNMNRVAFLMLQRYGLLCYSPSSGRVFNNMFQRVRFSVFVLSLQLEIKLFISQLLSC